MPGFWPIAIYYIYIICHFTGHFAGLTSLWGRPFCSVGRLVVTLRQSNMAMEHLPDQNGGFELGKSSMETKFQPMFDHRMVTLCMNLSTIIYQLYPLYLWLITLPYLQLMAKSQASFCMLETHPRFEVPVIKHGGFLAGKVRDGRFSSKWMTGG